MSLFSLNICVIYQKDTPEPLKCPLDSKCHIELGQLVRSKPRPLARMRLVRLRLCQEAQSYQTANISVVRTKDLCMLITLKPS